MKTSAKYHETANHDFEAVHFDFAGKNFFNSTNDVINRKKYNIMKHLLKSVYVIRSLLHGLIGHYQMSFDIFLL